MSEEGKQERKDFQVWKVTVAYVSQDGICLKCGNSLEHGFHRHHVDGDHGNNSLENLELRCKECHHASYRGRKKKDLGEHRIQEKAILEQLNQLIGDGIAGKLSGASAERLMEAMALAMKVSKRVNDIDIDIEYPPPAITLMKRLMETQTLSETFLDGFKRGVDSVRSMEMPQSFQKQMFNLHLVLDSINKRLLELGR